MHRCQRRKIASQPAGQNLLRDWRPRHALVHTWAVCRQRLEMAMRIGERGMKLRPGSDDKPNHRRLRRQPAVADGLAAPLLQFFATSPVACPYVPARAERKLIVELGDDGSGRMLSTTICRAPGFAAATASPTARLAAPAPRACRCASPPTVSPTPVRPGASATPIAIWAAILPPPARHLEQFQPVFGLSAGAPRRQRNGLDELCRLSRHGRRQPGAHQDRRVSRRFGAPRRRLAGRPAR